MIYKHSAAKFAPTTARKIIRKNKVYFAESACGVTWLYTASCTANSISYSEGLGRQVEDQLATGATVTLENDVVVIAHGGSRTHHTRLQAGTRLLSRVRGCPFVAGTLYVQYVGCTYASV